MQSSHFTVKSSDGFDIEVLISTPDKRPDGVVIYVNSSGPNTYNIKRKNQDGQIWYYHDVFANELTKRNIAYCRYSARGVRDGDCEPYFVEIDEEKYKTYLPHNSVNDVLAILDYITKNYAGIPVWLLGWSEGTIISPLIAKETNKIRGMFLCGYCNENLLDILKWQLNGNAALIAYRRFFDYDRKGYISKEDFDRDRYGVREALFGNFEFKDIDNDMDGKLTAVDFAVFANPKSPRDHLDAMLKAIESGNDEWLKNNHAIRLTSGWFKEHALLKPNKDVLPDLNIPIHIFSGEYDYMTPEFYTKEIEETFTKLGKTNLMTHYFKNHDHDLNFVLYPLKGELSEGMVCLFDTIKNSVN